MTPTVSVVLSVCGVCINVFYSLKSCLCTFFEEQAIEIFRFSYIYNVIRGNTIDTTNWSELYL